LLPKVRKNFSSLKKNINGLYLNNKCMIFCHIEWKIINSNELMATLIKKAHESHQSFEILKNWFNLWEKIFQKFKKALINKEISRLTIQCDFHFHFDFTYLRKHKISQSLLWIGSTQSVMSYEVSHVLWNHLHFRSH
jgi:hypothetical protein